MKPVKIIVENFLAYEGTHELDLSNINAATVNGQNGTGKSSLLIDAILYALFGQARKNASDLINELSDNMSVKFIFYHNDISYCVHRTQKESKQSLKLGHALGSVDLSERTLTATQAKLDKILGISYELLLSTAISQQEDINRLSTITPADREKIISEMLCIQQWENKKKKINEKLYQYKDLDNNIKDLERQNLDGNVKIGFIDDDLKTNKQNLESYLENKARYEADLKKLEKNLENFNKYKDLNSKKQSIEGELNSLESQLSSYNITDNSDTIKTQLNEIEQSLIDCKILKVEVEQQIKIIDKQISELQTEDKLVRSYDSKASQTDLLNRVPCVGLDIHNSCELLSSALTTKKQTEYFLKSRNVENLGVLLEQINNKYNELEKDKTSLIEDLQTLNENDTKLLVEKNNLVNKLEKLRINAGVKDKIAERILKLIELNQLLTDKPDFDLEEYQEVKKKLYSMSAEIQSLSITIVKLETEKEYITNYIAEAKEKLSDFYTIRNNVANYRVLQQAYNDIPSLLFEQAIPVIEGYTNEILNKIFPGEEISLRSFKETKSNTLQKSLDVVNTDGRDFKSLSGSEKARQSLALRLALARYNSEQNSVEMPFFIVDEGGFGSLDDENIYLLKLMLQNIAKEFELFLIITHIDELKDVFKTQITINSSKNNKIEVNYGS